MKTKLLAAVAVLFLSAALAWPTVARWRENRRRAGPYDPPQAERALRVPTEQDLKFQLPGRSREVLENADRFIVYSIEPHDWDFHAPRRFHNYPILGQTTITLPEAKKALLASFYDGFVTPPQRNSNSKFIALGCFNPRHALRAQHGGQTVDFVICFSCGSYKIFGSGADTDSHIFAAPQPAFDRILTQAGIPLAPR